MIGVAKAGGIVSQSQRDQLTTLNMRKSKEDESEDKYAEGPIKGIWKVIARAGDPSCGGL
ncbi:hypothetical protein N7536_007932 [Penicillium majusculum]|nr:hypothetical protein N7536_007932 [Penicillium majusculum]